MKGALKILLPLSVAVLAVVSCERGGRVIPVGKMERIYREMLLADQWLAGNPEKGNMADTSWFYEPIFKKYGFTTEDYQKSVGYYLNDPKRYAYMLERVEKDLRRELESVNAEIAREDRLQHKADSIARARTSVKAKSFVSFMEVFEADAMTDTVEIVKDSFEVYRPVPVIEDTVYHGPRLVIRDTTVKKDSLSALGMKLSSSPIVVLEPELMVIPDKSVRKLSLSPENVKVGN